MTLIRFRPFQNRRRWNTLPAILITLVALSAVQCSAIRTVTQGSTGQVGIDAPPVALPDVAGRLLYGRERALWTMDVRTGQVNQIARPPEIGQITSARWSPDGTQVAFARYEVRDRRIPVSEVIVAAADGSGARTVMTAEQAGTFFQAPVWGPNGDTLYALHTGRGADEPVRAIERLNLRSGERTKVLDEAAQFDVSPDGRWLTLAPTSVSWPSLVVIDLQSGEARTIVPERSFEVISAPRFDPRSQTILFSGASAMTTSSAPSLLDLASLFILKTASAHGPPMDLFTVPLAGGQLARVSALAADDPVAAWSPEGDKIAVLWLESLGVVRLPAGQQQIILTPGGTGSVDWVR